MATTGARTRLRRTVALVGVTALGAAVLSVTAPPGALAEDVLDPCDVPVVSETMVSQGLPSYYGGTSLARGKSTLVKYFLSTAPGCSALVSQLTITGGALTVQPQGGVPATVTLPTESHGPVSTSALAPSTSSTGNPTFLVRGDQLGPTGPGAPYSVTFTARLDYTVDRVSADGTLTRTPRSVTTAPTSRAVDAPSNPLRVLVVPIGDASKETARQTESPSFPAAAASMLHSSMQSLARLLPVADGVSGLDGAGGVRYHLLSSALVDVGGHDHDGQPTTPEVDWTDADGTYCPKSSHWNYLARELAGLRQKFNSGNAQPASLVLGVVWQGVSKGPEAGCIEGYADVRGTAAWARVVAREGVPLTGSLAGMELGHTLGAHPDAANQFHSRSLQADDTAPDRGYDVLRRRHIAADEPLMHYLDAAWHDDNTLAEPLDWVQTACVLTADAARSLAASGCDTAGDVGAEVAAQATQLHLAGRTDGTPSGTRAHTYVSPGSSVDPVDVDSPYQVVWTDTHGEEVARQGVRVVFARSEHDHEGGQVTTDVVGTFDVALAPPVDASAFRLVRVGTQEVVLYGREKDDRPVLTQVERPMAPSTPPVRYAEGPVEEFPFPPPVESALSDDGRLIAWETPGGVAVRRTVDRTSAPLLLSGATDPSFAHTRDALAVTVAGGTEVHVVGLDASGAVPVRVGSPQVVYRAPRDPFGNVDPSATVASPSLSPDDSRLVVSNGGFLTAQLYVMGTSGTCLLLGAPGCTQLTTTGGATDPSWSRPLPGRPQGLVAFTDNTPYDGGSSAVVAVIDPANPTAERTVLYPASSPVDTADPDFGGTRLAFTEIDGSTGATRVVSVAVGGWDDRRVEREAGGAVSLTADDALLSYAVEEPAGAGFRSVLHIAPTVQPTAERVVTASDAAPGQLRLDVVAQCGTAQHPVLTGVPPTTVTGGAAEFSVQVPTASLCPDASLRYDVTDGWQIAVPVVEDVVDPSAARPSVAITSPRTGSTSLQWRSVPLAVNGRSAAGSPLTVAWRLQGPGTDLSGTLPAGDRADLPPLTVPGTYTLTSTGTDATGTSTATSTFTVVRDQDADGVPASLEEGPQGTCLGAAPDLDRRNALLDHDGDGAAGPDDPEPCTSSLNAVVDFDADTLNPGAGGSTVTLYVTSSGVDLTRSSTATVAVTRIAGHAVSMPALSWTVDRRGRATAKVDRQALQSFVASRGLRGYVPVRLTSTAAGGAFAGLDPVDPVFQ